MSARVVVSPKSHHGDQMFFLHEGNRHPVLDGEWLRQMGVRVPADVCIMDTDELQSYRPSGPVVRRWTANDFSSPPQDSRLVRQLLASSLAGSGVEFGAGSSPFPVPLECEVQFVDIFPYEVLRDHVYPGQHVDDLVIPSYLGSLDDMSQIADSSMDFVVACHVIEHVCDPLGALTESARVLRRGGLLALVVPEMRKTFDRDRALTTTEHIVLDHFEPDKTRDLEHYREFYTLAMRPPKDDMIEPLSLQKHAERGDIHYHVWTYESFMETLSIVCPKHAQLEVVWSHPSLTAEVDIEFYVLLRKF